MNKIIINKVSKSFDEKKIINEISLDIEEGSFVSIMGPSGAGKTTLMNIMSGLEKIDSGSVSIDGTMMNELKEPKLTLFRREKISYVFQEYNLVDFLNVKENIVLPLNLAKKPIDHELLQKIATDIGIVEHLEKPADKLSGGQKQRVAIARSLMSSAEIIFADEPTGALDLVNRENIMKIFETIVRKYNKTIVLITHDPFVAAYADKVIFLLDGKIEKIIQKSPSDVIAKIIDDLEKKCLS